MIKIQDVRFPDFADDAIGHRVQEDVGQLIQRSQDENWPDDTTKQLITLTIRKAIAGAVVLRMLDDTAWRTPLMQLLDEKVTRPADRALFGL